MLKIIFLISKSHSLFHSASFFFSVSLLTLLVFIPPSLSYSLFPHHSVPLSLISISITSCPYNLYIPPLSPFSLTPSVYFSHPQQLSHLSHPSPLLSLFPFFCHSLSSIPQSFLPVFFLSTSLSLSITPSSHLIFCLSFLFPLSFSLSQSIFHFFHSPYSFLPLKKITSIFSLSFNSFHLYKSLFPSRSLALSLPFCSCLLDFPSHYPTVSFPFSIQSSFSFSPFLSFYFLPLSHFSLSRSPFSLYSLFLAVLSIIFHLNSVVSVFLSICCQSLFLSLPPTPPSPFSE